MLSLAGLTAAATAKTTKYKGKAAHAGTVKFKLSGKKVKSFRLSSIALSCSNSSYDSTKSAGPTPSIKVHKRKFSYDGYPQGPTGGD